MAAESIPVKSDWLRLDLQAAVVGENADGTVEIEWSPHPDRYEWLDDGSLRDISADLIYPPEVVRDMLKQAVDMMLSQPLCVPPSLPNASEFILERRNAVGAALDVPPTAGGWASHSAERLAALLGRNVSIAAICVDLVGSTRLQASDPAAYNLIVPLLSRELAEVVARFDGVVINFTGDGLIAGFASKSTIGCDTAFDAATAMAAIVYAAINPELRTRGRPAIDVRIAADAGEAQIHTFGSPHSRSQPDVTSIALSMVAKIQAVARPGEVWLGQTIYEHLHISRQELCHPVDLPVSWGFTNDVGRRYRLFEMPMKSRLRARS